MKKFKDLSLNIKLFILLAVISVIGIILRWDFIKSEAVQSFKFFKKDADTISVKK
jgi:hypothetical protein